MEADIDILIKKSVKFKIEGIKYEIYTFGDIFNTSKLLEESHQLVTVYHNNRECGTYNLNTALGLIKDKIWNIVG